MAVISQGIILKYSTGEGEAKVLTNLQEIPELGGETEAIEVTTLADTARKYTDGIKSFGDSLAFKFLYDVVQFRELGEIDGECEWQVVLPNDATCTFNGTCSVKFDGAGISTALTYTLNIKPTSDMIWA